MSEIIFRAYLVLAATAGVLVGRHIFMTDLFDNMLVRCVVAFCAFCWGMAAFTMVVGAALLTICGASYVILGHIPSLLAGVVP